MIAKSGNPLPKKIVAVRALSIMFQFD